jgi:proteic killer suppression protein
MIASFRHRGLRRLYEQGDRSGINPDHAEKIRKILSALEAAEAPEELALPSFHFHRLTGNRRGYFSVTVRANWRITFRFEQGRAYDVHLEDYH